MPKVSELTAAPAYGPGDTVYLVTSAGNSRKLATLRVATIAAMTAIATPTNGMSVVVTDTDRGGLFVFDTSEVTAANGGTIFDADDATTGSWVRQYSGPVNVKWFGAVGDGSTNDAPAIQAAIDSLPASTPGRDPARYINGGGSVFIPKGVYSIAAPIVVPQNVSLFGEGLNATVLKASGNIDVVQLAYKYSSVAEYYIANTNVRDLAIDGNGAAEAGITNRYGSVCNPVTYSKFHNLEIVGCKVGIHLFGAWNNSFENIAVRSLDKDSTTEGLFGFILQTVISGQTYGPSGHTVTAQGGAGGINNNQFRSCVVLYLKRCGILVDAISESHSYANTFTNCNFEQILKPASGAEYAPYTDLTRTPETGSPTALGWSGNPIGLHMLGRCAGFAVENCYFEAIAEAGTTNDGTGILIDDLGITFGAGASKGWQNQIRSNFFNSNCETVVDLYRCDYTLIMGNAVLKSAQPDGGYIVRSGSENTMFINEALGNINAASEPNYNYWGDTGAIGVNSPIRTTALVTIDSGPQPGIEIYRDGSTANVSAIRFRNGDNSADIGAIGYNFSQLILNGASTVSLQSNGAERLRIDGTTTAGQTSLLVYDVDNATLERVTVGAADTGGAGFKVLRIPN